MRQHSAYAGNCCHRATKYKTVHRRFPRWCGQQVLQQVHTDLASALREEGVIDEREAFIDASFASANGGKIGPTRRGKGVKILAIVDRADLPLPVSTHAANHHDATLVQLSFDLYMLEAKPEHVMSDKAYDSDKRNEQLLGQGVKRLFAWMQRKRRLLVRCEYYPANFLGVVQLASLTILLKRS